MTPANAFLLYLLASALISIVFMLVDRYRVRKKPYVNMAHLLNDFCILIVMWPIALCLLVAFWIGDKVEAIIDKRRK